MVKICCLMVFVLRPSVCSPVQAVFSDAALFPAGDAVGPEPGRLPHDHPLLITVTQLALRKDVSGIV